MLFFRNIPRGNTGDTLGSGRSGSCIGNEKAADIFSYGIILWELLTGKIPHFGIGPGLIKDYVNHKIRNKEEIIPFPKAGNIVLRCIASKCLMIKPEDRISLDNIIKYLTKANKCYEEVDEAILEMYNFVS